MVYYTYQVEIHNCASPLDGMVYFGKHSSSRPNIRYYGSGKCIKDYIKKFGYEGLNKTVLAYFADQESLAEAEKKLIQAKKKEYGDRCINMRISNLGGWDAVNSKLKRQPKEEIVERTKNAARSKQKATAEVRARWTKNIKLAYKEASPEWYANKYSKVSASLKRFYATEAWGKSKDARLAKNRATNQKTAKRWRAEFVGMFQRTPEWFRKYGKMKEAIALYQNLKTTPIKERQYEITRFMGTVG